MVKHWVVMVGAVCVACGGGSDDNPTGEAGLLQQAPHCVTGGPVFQVQGTLDGVAIDDSRSQNANVGLVNIGAPKFDTPYSNLGALGANQMGLHLTWQNSLAYGQTGPATGATLVPPSSHPQAGQTLCITEGEVGFVDGGSEDGVFKFRITGARAGADCSLDVPIDLRGCFD
jgi:hypothetical protein